MFWYLSLLNVAATLFAGLSSYASGFADGSGTSASFNKPFAIRVDSSSNAIVTEFGNHLVRKISPTGIEMMLFSSIRMNKAVDVYDLILKQ